MMRSPSSTRFQPAMARPTSRSTRRSVWGAPLSRSMGADVTLLKASGIDGHPPMNGRAPAVTRPRATQRLARAAGLSLVGHAALFGIIVGHAAQEPFTNDESGPLFADATPAAAPTWVD